MIYVGFFSFTAPLLLYSTKNEEIFEHHYIIPRSADQKTVFRKQKCNFQRGCALKTAPMKNYITVSVLEGVFFLTAVYVLSH